MKLLPYDSFTVKTRAPISEVIDALNIHTEKFHQSLVPGAHKEFCGTVDDTGFKIRPTRPSIRSLAIWISGKFIMRSTDTTIEVHMSYSPLTLALVALAFAILTVFMAFVFIDVHGFGPGTLVIAAIPIVQILMLWVVLTATFWSNASRARRLLERWLSQPALAITSSTQFYSTERHRRKTNAEYVFAVGLLFFMVGLIIRALQGGQPNIWLDAIVATSGILCIFLTIGGSLYGAFPLRREVGNRRLRHLLAAPGMLLLIVIVCLGLAAIIGQWVSALFSSTE